MSEMDDDLVQTSKPLAWRIVARSNERDWPCTIVDTTGKSLLGLHNDTPIIRSRDLAERIVAALNEQSTKLAERVSAGEGSWVCGRCGLAPEQHALGREADACVLDSVFRATDGEASA